VLRQVHLEHACLRAVELRVGLPERVGGSLHVVHLELLEHLDRLLRVVLRELQARRLHLGPDGVVALALRAHIGNVHRLAAVSDGLAPQAGRPSEECVDAALLFLERLWFVDEQHAPSELRRAHRAADARWPSAYHEDVVLFEKWLSFT